MYILDRASSFESLPPGPDPKSVAKSIHQYLPRLTKRGTLFRATQATIDQRHKEYSALIEAFFQENVPMLIQELREDKFIRDFFGYWRRDHDLEAKKDRQRPKTAPGDAISNGSFISTFFSTSSVSLAQSHAAQSPASPFPHPTPRLPSLRRRPKTADSSVTSSDAGSTLSVSTLISPKRSPPPSAPARMVTSFRDSPTSEDEHRTLERKTSPPPLTSSPPLSPSLTSSSGTVSSRRRVHSHRAKSSSPRAETFNVTSDFPLFLSSSTRDLLPSHRPPHSPTYVGPELGTLPEDREPPPCPRRQKDSSVNSDAAKRNRDCVVWHDSDELSSSDGDVLEHELLTPIDGAVFHLAVGKSMSRSSLQSNFALSNLSLQSRRSSSSWRTSSEHAASHLADADMEIDFPIITSGDSFHPISPPTTSSSSSTLCREVSDHRRRSLSQPLPFTPSVPTDVDDEEEHWSDHGEDIMEAYFGGPDPFFTASVEDPLAYDGVSSECSHDFPYDPPDSPSVTGFPTPRQKASYIEGTPGAFHRPWARESLAPSLSRQTSSSVISSFPSIPTDETLVVKAVLDDAIVVFRVERDASFAELRHRVHEKFARSEGVTLRDAFVLAYVPPGVGGGGGGKRVSTVSSMSTGSADLARALPLENEEDWAIAVAGCGSKVTIRVSHGANPQ